MKNQHLFLILTVFLFSACSQTELPVFDDSVQSLLLYLPTQEKGNLAQRTANPVETAAWQNWLAQYGKTFRARKINEFRVSELPRWCIRFNNHQNGETVFCRYGGAHGTNGRIDYGLEVLSDDNEALAAADKLIRNSTQQQ